MDMWFSFSSENIKEYVENRRIQLKFIKLRQLFLEGKIVLQVVNK